MPGNESAASIEEARVEIDERTALLPNRCDDPDRDGSGGGSGSGRLKTQNPEAAEEENALVRKLDGRIVPLACLLYLCAYLDRSNLGNARLQGLPEDVLGGDPTGELFDWVYASFFITYIALQVPCTVFSKYYDPRLWISLSAILWGTCSTLMSTAQSFSGLLVARLALGVFEAAFGPAVVLYVSFWYTKAEYATRVAYWFGFAAVAGAFSGLIAYGIEHLPNAPVSNWRILFFIEGIPTVVLGFACFWLLPGRPDEPAGRFLTHGERKLAMERMDRGTSGDRGKTVNRKHVVAAFTDWRVYTAGVIYFGLNAALASTSAFLPTIIETMGHQEAQAQLMTVPPYACAGAVLILGSAASDRWQTRGALVTGACVLGGVGYILLLNSLNNTVRYLATFCITSGTYTSIGLVIAWFTHNLGSESKRAAGVPLFGAIGQCGAVLGSHLYPLTEGPYYVRGFTTTGALLFVAAACAFILSTSFRTENKRRNEMYGIPDPDARVDTSELADKAPEFRYIP
ncbi:MFS general substrate transporter [Coniophora puteana RWD-64-598 SS2]|uniref:MFS general substrate transporter n=1 Tax=Coniophora puteana (strain RWD-64-598) TaxID=741705 RepID=A0A5M3MIZ6_CONPW|nr:MFS general substrate transporter [Coniophora puteana RWD-64-598 SS2]EIW78591.1 MFS general substrate transporter [Coniophora puteana RWD-64-598 SS2]